MSRMTHFLLIVGGLVIASVGGLYLTSFLEKSESGATGQALVGGPFQLTAHNNDQVTESSFPDEHKLIYFGFTSCPDVCPTDLQVMAGVMDALGEDAARVRPMMVTVDPERDTTEIMAAFVPLFHSKLIGLTGTPEQIQAVARTFRVYYAKVEDEASSAEYTMDHSNFFYFMSPDGVFITHFGGPKNPDQIAERIRDVLSAS